MEITDWLDSLKKAGNAPRDLPDTTLPQQIEGLDTADNGIGLVFFLFKAPPDPDSPAPMIDWVMEGVPVYKWKGRWWVPGVPEDRLALHDLICKLLPPRKQAVKGGGG